MVDATEAALGLGAALAAGEVTGVTNITGGGGGIGPDVMMSMMENMGGGDGGGLSQGVVAALVGAGGGDGGDQNAAMEAVRTMQESMKEQTEQFGEMFEQSGGVGETVNLFSGGDPSGGNQGGPNTTSGSNANPSEGPGKTSEPSPEPGPSDFDPDRSEKTDLQDWSGTGGVSGSLALAGEAGSAAGSTVNDIVEGTGDIIGSPTGKNGKGITGFSRGAGQATGKAINQFL